MLILSKIAPVLLVLLFGYFLRKKELLSREGSQAMKNLVTTFMLPVVLFHALATVHYTGKTVLIILALMACELIAFGIGFALRSRMGRFGRLLPFFLASFEGGMIGYPLYGILCGEDQLGNIATIDIANTIFTFTLFLALLMATISGTFTAQAMVSNITHSTVFWGVFLGILLGATGLMERFLATGAGSIYLSVKDMITSPVSCIIILVVGYDLQLDRQMLKECVKPVLLRMAVMTLLMIALLTIMQQTFSQREMRMALMLYLFMPPTYVVSAYAREQDDAAFVSTSTSLYTLFSIVVFVILNIVFVR
ncbi:MAG: AEC family transporter [Lachnospiraceae bacterium]|nr:AEC family transporter [Lachnospiraceae bacterium]